MKLWHRLAPSLAACSFVACSLTALIGCAGSEPAAPAAEVQAESLTLHVFGMT